MPNQLTEQQLRHTSLFANLTDELCKELFSAANLSTLRLGHKVCEFKQPTKGLFILVSGKVRAILLDDNQQEGTLFTLSRPGDFFGEESIFKDSVSPFTVRTSGETVLMHLNIEELGHFAAMSSTFKSHLEKSVHLSDQCRLLKTSPDFESLSYWQIRSLISHCQPIQVDANEDLLKDSTNMEGLYIVIRGAVELTARKSSKKQTISCGHYFGFLFSPERQEAVNFDVRSTGASEILFLSKGKYEQIKQFEPDLAYALRSALSSDDDEDAHLLLSRVASDQSLAASQSIQKAELAETEPDEALVPKLRRKFHKYPFILQQSAMDCGAACLGMACSFYGKKINLNYIRELADVGRHGTDMLTLAEAAETLGFVTRGVRTSYEGLLKLKMPLICHWDSNHYVVVYEMTPAFALIGDPATEVKKVDRDEFTRSFTGFALELSPTKDFGIGVKGRTSLARFLPVLLPYKKVLFDILFASLIYQILMLATPIFTQVIVDKVLIHQSVSMLNIMLLGMVLLTLFQTAFSALRAYFLAFVAMKVDQSMFVQFYRHVLTLPLQFFEQRKIGDIMTRFGENEKIRQLLTGTGITVLLDVLMMGVYLAIIFYYNAVFGVCVTAYLMVFAIVAVSFTPVFKKISRLAFDKEVASNSFLIESFYGIEKIKSAAAERRTRWQWEELFVESLNVNFWGALTGKGAEVVAELVHLGGTVLLLWFGAHLVIQDQISIGQLMALNLMVGRVSDPILRLISMWDEFQEVTISLERLGDVFEAKPEEPDPAKKLVLPSIAGTVKFEGVTFRYSKKADSNALQDVTFETTPGQLVALVGRSGSGKTTLLKLIQGLYLPTNGSIKIDGHDISLLSLGHLRSQIGIVSQHEYLFSGTIRDNICFNRPDASSEKVVKAGTLAGIHDFINTLPAGYETTLSEGGYNFSGGQRQRISIAKALLGEPRILLLDEATSFLDAESERKIQESMATLRKGRTIFIAAHRLSTIRNADLILVLDRGQIVERGTHDSLMADRQLYYYLSSQQLEL